MQELQGQLHRTEDTYHRALRYAAEQGEGPLPVTGLAHVGLGALRLEWNDLPAASHHLREGLALGQRLGIVEIQVVGHAVLAQVHQVQGHAATALEAIGEAQRLAQRYPVSAGTAARVAAIQARLSIVRGDLHAAAEWAQQSDLGADAGLTQPLEFEQITRAWLLLAQGEPAQAEESLVRLLAVAEAQGRPGSAVEILALLALARQSLGQPSPALDALARALSLAEPAGYVRTFVDKGPPMAALLDQLASPTSSCGTNGCSEGTGLCFGFAETHGVAPAYVRKLLAAFDPGKTPDTGAPSPPPGQPLVEPLSDRELEVLERIAAGLSNREIGAELFITVGTVKWHVNNIFGKLQVKRRTEAVARARELGLL
jgi:LuxR family maltose regulon positive regulatory protein